MEKYYKLQKINRKKFEDEGSPMYFMTLEKAKQKALELSNEKYGYCILEVMEICRELEV